MAASALSEQTLPIYFKQISRQKPLSEDEEVKLSLRIQKGDRLALDRLVKANLRFVAKVALHYQNRGLTLSDLISEGNWGLIQAARRYDGRRNIRFISYAVWWIRRAILQAIVEKGSLIRQPETYHGIFRRLSRAEHYLQQQLGREPSEAELAATLGITEKQLSQALAWRMPMVSLDTPIEEEGGCTLHDMLPSETSSADRAAEEESEAKQLDSALRLLDKREGRVLRLYFGLDGMPCHTFNEVGEACHLTGERVRQLKHRALKKLRSFARFGSFYSTMYCSGLREAASTPNFSLNRCRQSIDYA